MLRAYNEAIILNDKPLADSLSSVCNNFAINDSIEAGKLWQQNLHYASKFGDKEEIRIMLSQQEHSLPFNPDKLMDLALAYNKLGNNEYALELLDIVRASNSEYNGLRLLSVQLPIYKGIGNFKDALSIYEKYSIAYDSINLKKFEYLTQTIQARNKIEIQAQKEAERNTRIIWSCIGGLVILVLLVGVLLLTVRNKQSEKALAIQIARTKEAENAQLKTEQERLALEAENLAHRVDTLEEESRSLKELMATSVELPEEVQKAIQVRIEMLNSLLAGYITSNEQYEKPYDVWVRELTENTEAFMNSNRLAFQASHPRFIQYFEEHGLTEDEINYVCLYAIGLRGKEVGNYMKKPGHVNISSAIRKKLGIDKHETNIGIYVRKLLKSL